LVYDETERRIWCSDCETEVEPFDAFMQLVGVFSSAKSKIDRRMQELAEAEKFAMRSRAAKRMDEYWRSQTMAPLCPHCNGAILPEDVVSGLAQTSKSIEIAARKRKQSARPTP
jgi:Zn finger protein HypA/HybF involved in hydrogenase expression